ncbi:hypothetical protein LDL08_02675 [Nonomuraea glycinis]|uniref:hypothetical protein n=1 Tax=Nonomuraea glycinis TaxID=2047744 RepID=UPI00166908DD|nr:hypothetical protein [Nonomuraea glycinis]MCA2175082.1 hypothetical protein [Nonomuraea glycinis]
MRKSFGEIVGGLLTVAAIGIWIVNADPGPFAPPHPPTHQDVYDSGSGDGGSGLSAATPKLKASPESGSVRRVLSLTGAGFPPDSEIRLTFHATAMGSARTNSRGSFKAKLKVPSADFYAHFPGQTFSISTTYWTLDGVYRGNGPGTSYRVT